MVSDQQSIPNFRRHMILELHSRTLLEPSPSNIEKDKYYAVDYGKNYYTGRTRSAPDERQFHSIEVPSQITADRHHKV